MDEKLLNATNVITVAVAVALAILSLGLFLENPRAPQTLSVTGNWFESQRIFEEVARR